MAVRRRRELEEEPDNHERWMVTYADMVTLLMVLFIVMFAMSQVDDHKFAALKQSLAAGFGESPVLADGNRAVLESSGNTALDSLDPANGTRLDATQQAAVDAAVRRAEQQRTRRAQAEAHAEADRLLDLRARLEKALRAEGLQDDVVSTVDRRGLVVSLVSRHVVFAADRAELSPRGTRVVSTLARVLRRIDDPLQIDGHTNQVPVRPKYYTTDWDLSSARAVTVLRHLNEREGIAAERLSASAHGHEKPLVDPSEEGSQRVNKRVDVVVLADIAAESQQWLAQAARERTNRGEN